MNISSFAAKLYDNNDKVIGIFETLEKNFGIDGNTFFQTIADLRMKQAVEQSPALQETNIKTKMNSPQYAKCIQSPIADKPEPWFEVEKQLLTFFGNWAEAWCAFNIWNIHHKYHTKNKSSVNYNNFEDSQDEQLFIDFVVQRVEEHSNLYYSPHSPYPMLLPDIILLTNLYTLVWEQHWYEILYKMEISLMGTHFILAQQNNNLDFPVVVSTALINTYENSEDWLSFAPFFRADYWHSINQNKLTKEFERLEILPDMVKFSDIKSYEEFESSLWHSIEKKSKCCEVIRLTVAGNTRQRIFLLYLCQKRLMQQLHNFGFDVAFTIIEQPLMLHYYQSLTDNEYIPFSYCKLTPESAKSVTHKGIWVVDKLKHALSQCRYQHYKTATFDKLKQHRLHGNEPRHI